MSYSDHDKLDGFLLSSHAADTEANLLLPVEYKSESYTETSTGAFEKELAFIGNKVRL